MPSTYRIGVMGHTGRGHYGHGLDHVWREIPATQIVAVSDADARGRAEAMKRLGVTQGFSDYRQMLDEAKPDIVSVAPRWADQHCDMVVAAAERGVHVYLEKPMCRTLEESDRMVAACTAANVKLAIAFQTRYSPILAVIRGLLEDGEIGDLLELRARGKEDRRGGGEDLWVLGSHVLNVMHYFGGPVNWCMGSVFENGIAVNKDHVKPGPEGLGPLAGDTVRAVYGMDEGVTGYFASHRNTTAGRPWRYGVQMFGSRGIIEILTGYLPQAHFLPDASWSPGRSGKKWMRISSQGVDQPEPLSGKTNRDGNVVACLDLIQSIEEDRQPEANIFEAQYTVEMVAAVFESHRMQKPVSLPLANRQNPLTLLG